MATYNPSANFHDAASYLSSAPSASKVSTAVKLELYGLFKYLTVSANPTSSRPSLFDMTGRAKWDAWSAAGKKYGQPEDAEMRYLEIAGSLGWVAGASSGMKKPEKMQETIEDIWDNSDDDHSSQEGGGGSGGMGLSVSSMAPPPQDSDGSIHGLAVSNDVSGLKALLEQHPDENLNAMDEYGYTPLHLAADRGNVEVVKLLLNKGADSTLKDPDGFSPLELAQVAGHGEVESALVLSS